MRFQWVWIFWLSYAAWGCLEFWVFNRDRRTAKGVRADRSSIWFLIFMIVAGLFAAFTAFFQVQAARITVFRFPIFLSGIGLMWAGMALRLWAINTLGKFFRTTVMLQDSHELVTTGPYQILRHPAYTGSALTLLGIGVALGNWLSIGILLVMPLVGYGYRIRVEEQALSARFGAAYDSFARDRWRLLPFLY